MAKETLKVGSRVIPTKLRLQLYSQFYLYLRNNHKVDVALSEMYDIYSDDGKKPNNKIARIIRELQGQNAAGNNLSVCLAAFIPEGEYFLLSAGDKSSYVKESLQQAIRLIKTKQRIADSVRKAFVYNIFLSILMVGVLVAAAYFLIPQSMVMVKPEQLTGFAYGVYAMSRFVVDYGIYTLFFLILLVILVRWAQPNYTGRHRITLDKIWPFSLYRAVNGATFLVSLSSLTLANVQTSDALKELAEQASPYLKQRILAALVGIHSGAGLGNSLHVSGYQFPDPIAIRHLRILGSKAGVDTAIANFADDWLEETIKKTDTMADIVRNVGMILVFMVAAVVVAGTAMIQRASQSAMGIL